MDNQLQWAMLCVTDAVSKPLRTVLCHSFHDMCDKDTVVGQNLPNRYKGLDPPLYKLVTSNFRDICQKRYL